MNHRLKIATLTFFLVLTGIYSALTSSGGAPLGFSSAPGDSDCTSCHGGLAVNSGPATRTLTFNGSAASSYVPGQTYNLSLTVTRATRNGTPPQAPGRLPGISNGQLLPPEQVR
ncbi:MAG: hypothetical protein EBS08_00120 [Cytophagia bacterium]|nr:hypothetical protein [Cytophagia bacterium]